MEKEPSKVTQRQILLPNLLKWTVSKVGEP